MGESIGIVILIIFGAVALYLYFKWVYRLAEKKRRNPMAWILFTIVIPFGIIFIPWYLYYLPNKDKLVRQQMVQRSSNSKGKPIIDALKNSLPETVLVIGCILIVIRLFPRRNM